jgi:hypothetical protein
MNKNKTFTMSDFDTITKATLAELPEPERQMVEVVFRLAKVKLELMLIKRQLPADMDEN